MRTVEVFNYIQKSKINMAHKNKNPGNNSANDCMNFQGYDMEDAMIINKASEERGLAHGSIYKSEFVELEHEGSYFARNPNSAALADTLGIKEIIFSVYCCRLSIFKCVFRCRWPTVHRAQNG